MPGAEFFFDPVCPWAWITSRWIEEVRRQQPLDVTWRFIGLRIINEHRDYDHDFPPFYLDLHTTGLRLLRVAAALRASAGPDAVGPYYAAVGGIIHVDRGSPDPARVLADLGHDPALGEAASDTAWDDVIRTDGDEAVARAGRDIGTPVITLDPPDGPSFFGPVISRVPRGPAAVELWETVGRIARFPGFAELKRAIRERPEPER